MKTKTIQRLFSIFTGLSLLANSLYAPAIVLAQEVSPSPTSSPAETTLPTSSPTESPSVTPTENPTTSPSPTVEPSVSPTPTVDPTVAPTETPNENNQSQAPPIENQSPNPSQSPDPSVTPSPSPTPNNELQPIAPTITTDKLDYFPYETVKVNGHGLAPVSIYSLHISSEDEPQVSFSTPIISDATGSFEYDYPLDGYYRPNYKIELFDQGNNLIAYTNFTDADTGFKNPTSNSANGPGDSWSNPTGAYSNGGGHANGDDGNRHRYYDYNFGVPSGSVITGIEVSLDTWSSDNSGCQIGVELSWNGGSNWTSEKTHNLTSSESTYTLGGNSDNWGRNWTADEFTNANFRSRIRDIDPGRNCKGQTSLDWIRIKVHYTEIKHVQVRLCHKDGSSGNYSDITVDDDSVIGPAGHGSHSGDIIPPFTYYSGDYYGKNWDEKGQATWSNQCVTPTGKISLTKDTDPESSHSLNFNFQGSLGNFDLHDDETKEFKYKTAGTYTIFEDEKNGWKLSDVSCNRGAEYSVNLNNNSLTIYLSKDQDVSCTFKNVKTGSISGFKYNDKNGNGKWDFWPPYFEHSLKDWVIFIDSNDNQALDPGEISTTTNFFGNYKFENLLPGTYEICEVQQDGWTNTDPGTLCQTVVLHSDSNGCKDEDNVNFGNQEHQEATIKVVKDVVDPDGKSTTDSSTGFDFDMTNQSEFTLYDEDGGKSFTVQPGTYSITEATNKDYIFEGCQVTGGEINYENIEDGISVTVQNGDNITVTCVNKQDPIKITGTKWEDLNGNGQRDSDNETQEPGVEGWTINLSLWNGESWDFVTSTTTDIDGNYIFGENNDLKPGEYLICEVQQAGWEETYPGYNSCHDINVGSNETVGGNDFGNFHYNPSVEIAKTGSKTSVGQSDSVVYTLTVTNTGNLGLYSLNVTDALPGGFAYLPSSTTLGGSFFPDPTISGSTLVWSIGYLAAGESTILEYTAATPSDLAVGTYTNWATCSANYYGLDREYNRVYDEEESPSVECDPVSFDVNRSSDQSYGGNVEGQVLGASTELPATGSETTILVIALGMAGVGLGIKLLSRRKYAKN